VGLPVRHELGRSSGFGPDVPAPESCRCPQTSAGKLRPEPRPRCASRIPAGRGRAARVRLSCQGTFPPEPDPLTARPPPLRPVQEGETSWCCRDPPQELMPQLDPASLQLRFFDVVCQVLQVLHNQRFGSKLYGKKARKVKS